ncbi:hypothetical protein I6N90_19895 [Paenibacillus sp. GSMTC-2017]|uniref:hypothetical protein n=1 Tax=Paenibacillus sp. GSMTC-2017 TaxID=2794350 RepID=UPI0018D86F5E|nr:hypothetical protein [Paenibacillus sp. GSMTC-2017]MBH5320069.1 hypothetical protein [Paenibacillus sp. GSMTC-2017]
MKRLLTILLVILILTQVAPYGPVEANASEIKTAEQSIELANQYMQDHMDYEGDFFEIQSSKGESLQKSLAISGNEAFHNLPIFVYGDALAGAEEGTKYGNDTRVKDSTGQLRALGFTFLDEPYANPLFNIDDVTYVRRWIKEPWVLPTASKPDIKKDLLPDNPNDTHTYQWLKYEPGQFATSYSVLNQWVKSSVFLPQNIKKMTGDRKYFNKTIEGVPAVLSENPEDYIYMLQPPTYHSWGVGIAFYYYGGNGPDNMEKPNHYLYYEYFRYKPFSLLANDLSANFEALPASANAGDEVQVSVRLKSTFSGETPTDYGWDIKAKNGASLPITFSGHENKLSGDVMFPADKGELLLRARFVMPASDVTVKFTMNKNKNAPKELTYDNNNLSGTIKYMSPPPPVQTDKELGYNILSKEMRMGLKGGGSFTATLPNNSSWIWTGNATGKLNVVNGQPDLFHNFKEWNNPAVDEANTVIVRQPEVSMKLLRTDFDDDPVGGKWSDWPTPKNPKVKTGNIYSEGTVNRPYKIEHVSCEWVKIGKDKEERRCYTYYSYGGTSAVFPSQTDSLKIGVRIYNGREDMPALSYLNKIDQNNSSAFRKSLYWKNEPYAYNTVRWMAHEDENGSLYDWTPVNGQYEREFTHQAKGEVEWEVKQSQAGAYQRSRDAAKKKQNVQGDYDLAVFASDKELQKHDYPIKSGYYFNPIGQYSFTIETEMYKQTTGKTKDHQDLVDKIIDSFSYESNLIYINNNKEAVNIRNGSLSKRNNVPVPAYAKLTRNNPTGVNGLKLLDVKENYNKDEDEIPYTQEQNGTMHANWKNILEGYTESKTLNSYDDFKYREFVKNGQAKMYKIKESTTVTITVGAPEGQKLYTHAHMPDGTYNVRVTIGDVNVRGMPYAYKILPNLEGIDLGNSNNLEITVRGSMYDDLNS